MENNHFPADSHNDLGKLVFHIFRHKLFLYIENNHFPADSHNGLGKLVFIIFHNKLGTFFRNSHEIEIRGGAQKVNRGILKPVAHGCTVYLYTTCIIVAA
jgi:hypothetical protein